MFPAKTSKERTSEMATPVRGTLAIMNFMKWWHESSSLASDLAVDRRAYT